VGKEKKTRGEKKKGYIFFCLKFPIEKVAQGKKKKYEIQRKREGKSFSTRALRPGGEIGLAQWTLVPFSR